MKQIVNTTGEFQLYLPYPDHHAQAHRPSVVAISTFFHQHAAAGRLVILGQVNDEASDEEFAKYLESSKGDEELAIASFISAFPIEDAPVVEKPKRGSNKG